MLLETLRKDKVLALAPIAGMTDLPFRLLTKPFGADLVYSELVSSEALVRDSQKTFRMLRSHPDERPAAMQLFGANPEVMGRAAEIVEENGAEWIDINMGCPANKVIGKEAGSAMCRYPDRVEETFRQMVRRVDIPVTVKIRSGWDDQLISAPQIAKIAEAQGISLVTVHGRTTKQRFSGKADWGVIETVKRSVSIPVIGNGDVTTPEEAMSRMEESGVDGVMIGRGAIGQPWIFSLIRNFFETGSYTPPNPSEIRRIVLDHYRRQLNHYPELTAVRLMRKHVAGYTKGLYDGARFRDRFNRVDSAEEAVECIADYFDLVSRMELAA